MKRVSRFLLFFLALIAIPTAVQAQDEIVVDPGDLKLDKVTEGLRDKGVDWLKDQAKDAGKSWVFDTGRSETMHEILQAALERANGEGKDKRPDCQGAVMGKASSILSDLHYEWNVKTGGKLAFETATKLAGLASGFGAAAGEGGAINWLMRQYADAAKDKGEDAVFDKIKKLFIDEEKPQFELFEDKGKQCDYKLTALWDIVHGTYRVLIEGDCRCAPAGNVFVDPQPLGKWWISFEGHVKLFVDKKTKATKWLVQPVDPVKGMKFAAQCNCSKKALRKPFTEEQTVPAPTGTPLSPTDRQQIQAQIDAKKKALEEEESRVRDLAGQMAGARSRGDQQGIKEITEESRKSEAEQARLKKEIKELEKQLQGGTTAPGQGQQPSAGKPGQPAPAKPAGGVSYEPNPFASRILQIHNAERAVVGAPPLRWNAQLEWDATVYARELAQTRQLIHAPREGRGIERENLLKARRGWSAEQMMSVWTSEKRDFVAGYFPNVARDGNWMNVAHYTQLVWPTTTDIGCGYATGGGFAWLVCRYSPGGNKDNKPVGYRPPM